MSERIYLDFNATTPLAPEVAHTMERLLSEAQGNPSSLHWAGAPARDAIERARSQVAALLACDATEVVFTSGGTEANNQAIKGAYFARRDASPRPHLITTQVEHPSVLAPCRFLESLGAAVTYLPVDRWGQVDPAAVEQALRPETILVSVMHANNEVGTLQPIAAIAELTRPRGVLLHTDAAQSVGKIPVEVETLGVDLLSLAGHKLYAPKGAGALYVREGVGLEPWLHGADQEAGRRAGTESALLAGGLGTACEVARSWAAKESIGSLRDHFWQCLREACGERVVLNGHPSERLPNTLHVSFPGHLGEELLGKLPGVAASTGAACHAGRREPSHVLRAMKVAPAAAAGAIRFSLGRTTTVAEVVRVAEMLSRVV
jgi:cysteine desulfurase